MSASLRRSVHELLVARRGRYPGVDIGSLAERVVDELAPSLAIPERGALIAAALDDAVGTGPLAQLLADPTVSEILLNGPGAAFVERAGRLEPVALDLDALDLQRVIERILGPLGLRLDGTHPIVDARMADGSRVHAVGAPLAVPGPAISIRRFRPRSVALEEFCDGTAREHALRALVANRANLLVSGATNSGKTTLLDALAREAGADERVVAIEDTLELRLDRPHVVRLETRPANAEGIGAVTLRDLVRAALRMRPDRLVIGEVRSAEAFDLIQALNTGHRGCLATLHAHSAADALVRLETLALLAGTGVDASVVRRQIASGIDAVVHTVRNERGTRRVAEILETNPL